MELFQAGQKAGSLNGIELKKRKNVSSLIKRENRINYYKLTNQFWPIVICSTMSVVNCSAI